MRSLLAAMLLALAVPVARAETQVWQFRVLLDGREIGEHRFELDVAGAQRELRSRARFDVRVLFVDAYRYRHEAVEVWDGGCLQSLVARTETNGQREDVRAAMRDGTLIVDGASGRAEHAGCVMSFAYWDPRILTARRLLNSQTGELLPVQVATLGEETLDVRGQRVAAQRHRISGPQLQIDLWYSAGGWVALEALAQGGRRLRYELA